VQLIREQLQLTGTHVGCDTAQCGACTVHLNGRAVKACSMLAVQAARRSEITTIEGLAKTAKLHPMQAAFRECHGLQCGFCTPGMVMSAVQLLKDKPKRHRTRDPRRPGGQHLPLHRLSQHRPRRSSCARAARSITGSGRGVSMTDMSNSPIGKPLRAAKITAF
jgi:hypothetical protein